MPKKESQKEKSAPIKSVPRKLEIEIGPRLYEEMKRQTLKEIPPILRGYTEDYFEYLKNIKPEQLIDGIENQKTLKSYYNENPSTALRLSIAMTRGLLKVLKSYREQLNKVLSPEIALLTLKYENPVCYEIIQRYGKKGKEYLEACIDDVKTLLNLKPPRKRR